MWTPLENKSSKEKEDCCQLAMYVTVTYLSHAYKLSEKKIKKKFIAYVLTWFHIYYLVRNAIWDKIVIIAIRT